MSQLEQNWVTSGLIDFEYKKYQLLGYLQEVNQYFFKKELFPSLSDLIFHYRNLRDLQMKKELLTDNFPKKLKMIDLEKAKLVYEKMIQDTELMKEIESIIEYALPHVQFCIDEGKEIYEFYETNMEISPVGINPADTSEGFLFLVANDTKETPVYSYKMTVFTESSEKYRAINTKFVKSFFRNLSTSFESVKREMISSFKGIHTPAAYCIATKIQCPHEATFLPIAKRMLIRTITKYEG